MRPTFTKIKIAVIALLFSLTAKAQIIDTTGLNTHSWRCGNDSLMFNNIVGFDSLVSIMRVYNNSIIANATSTVTPSTYTIPVVFHIIEPVGTPTTVTYAQIKWQVAALNAAYQNQMQQFIGETPGLEASMTNIQFQLACISAPANIWSNAAEPGVMRYTTSDPTILNQAVLDPTSSPTTYTPMLSMTNPTSAYFNKSNYLNIYCVPSINGAPGGTTLGFATFPWYNISSGAYTFDGIVLRIDAIGNNSYPTNFPLNPGWNHGFTLAHEAGHYCGLYHTFQPKVGTNLALPVACYGMTGTITNTLSSAYQDGDMVFDTPPSEITYDLGSLAGINSCNESNEPYQTYTANPNYTLLDQNDQLENFMCYSHDDKVNTFTKLQAQRMWGTFDPNFGSAPRSVLTSTANLVATGVYGWPTSCAAESGIVTGIFNYGIGTGSSCTSVNVHFLNPTSLGFSTPSTTTYTWNYGDGSANTYSVNPTHTYTNQTTYTVTCTAANGTLTNTYSTTISTNFNVQIVGQSSQTGSVTASTVCAGVEQTIYIQFGPGVSSAVLTDGTHYYTVTNYMSLSQTEIIPYLFTTSSTVSYSLSPASCGGISNGVATFNVINCCPSLITNGGFESGNTGFNTDLHYGALSTGYGTYTVSPLCSSSSCWFNWLSGETQNVTGNMMLIDGFSGYNNIVTTPSSCGVSPTPTPRVWQQSVTGLLPNTPYFYSFKILENYSNFSCPGGLNFKTSITSNTLTALPTQTLTPAVDNIGTTPTLDFVVYTYTFTTPPTTSVTTTFSVTINQINDFKGQFFDYFLDNITLNQMTPGVQAIGNATICPTATVQLNAISNCSTGSYNYIWSPSTALTNTAIANPVASPSTTTVYTLVAVSTSTVGSPPTYVSTVTVTVNNAPSISITGNTALCPGVGSATLTASGASTYTWQPGSSTSNPIIFTPTVTTTYTVSGNNTGCTTTGTQTVTVTVNNANTIISVTPSSTNICSNNPVVNLTASGATTYTWFPAATLSSTNTSTVTANPIVNTTYTVTGTNNGCVGTNTISVSVIPAPVLSYTFTPTNLCLGHTATLTVSGATTYSWSTGATTPSITVSPSVTTTYSVTGSYTNGCSSSVSETTVVEYVNVTATTYSICRGQSTVLSATGGLTPTGASTYTWSPSGSLSSSSGVSVTATPTATTIYTVSGTVSGCTGISTHTISIVVNPNPSLTVTPTSTMLCTGSSATLTASGATNYTWTPITGLSCTTCSATIATPTVAGVNNYSVTGSYTTGCAVTSTLSISDYTASCSGTAPSYTITSSGSYTSSPGLVSQNMYINAGTYTITSSNVAFTAGVSITIASGATLIVNNSWLHACATCSSQQLWQGIIVQNGATLIVSNSIIEDAMQGVYTQSSATTTPIPSYNITNSIFNNNATGIYIDTHQGDLSGNIVTGTLFTCRKLGNHVIANIGSTQSDVASSTPLLHQSTLNPIDLNLAGTRTAYGIYINEVNVATTVVVGEDKASINIFDNMDYGIYSYASSLNAKNNTFQNLTGNTNTTPPIGVGIYSDVTQPGHCSLGCTVRGVLTVGNVGTSKNNNEINYFNNCLVGVYTNEMRQVYINNNFFSNETTATTFSTSGSHVTGQYGVYNTLFGNHSSATDFEQMIFANNSIQNYATGNFIDFTELYNTNSGSSNGSAYIYNNIISGSGISNNYCTSGLYIQQSYAQGANTGVPQDAISISTNSITNVSSNCINISSVGASGATTGFITASQNSLTVQYNAAATSLQTPPLAAVNISGSEYVKVSNNPVVGSTYSGSYPSYGAQFIEGVYVSQSPGSRITCNAVSGVGEGFVWSGTNHGSLWLENTMHNSQYGLVLRSSGIMGNQGALLGFPAHICGDVFGNSDLSVSQTLSDASNPGLSGSTSVLFNAASTCTGSNTYLPCVNNSIGLGSVAYTASGSTVTLQASSGVSYGLCTSEGGNGRMAVDTTNLLGAIPPDSILQGYLVIGVSFPVYDYETHWAKQYYVNKIKPAINANTAFANAKAFAAVDVAIRNGNYNAAQAMNNAISPNNIIEKNWKQVDNTMLKAQNNSLNQSDITALQNIAIQCPLSGGSIVYKARAILNTQFNTVFTYPNDCPVNNGTIVSRTENTSGIANTALAQTVNLYPNPNNGTMMLDYSINDDARLEIMDITGNLVGTYDLPATGTTIKIQNNYLQNGMYLYRVISNRNAVIKIGKIVVMQ